MHLPPRRARALALATLVLALHPGCIQRTLINSIPDGATVRFEGTEIGNTPDVVIHTRSGVARDYILKVEKPGYEPASQVLSAGYRADESLLLLLLGIVPYFFSARLEASYPPVHLRAREQPQAPPMHPAPPSGSGGR